MHLIYYRIVFRKDNKKYFSDYDYKKMQETEPFSFLTIPKTIILLSILDNIILVFFQIRLC